MRKWASTSAKTMLMAAGFVALGSGVSFAGSGDASTSGDGSILDSVPGADPTGVGSTVVHQNEPVDEHASTEQIVVVEEHTSEPGEAAEEQSPEQGEAAEEQSPEQGEAAEEQSPEFIDEVTAPLPEAEEVADALGAADPIGDLLGAAGVGL